MEYRDINTSKVDKLVHFTFVAGIAIIGIMAITIIINNL